MIEGTVLFAIEPLEVHKGIVKKLCREQAADHDGAAFRPLGNGVAIVLHACVAGQQRIIAPVGSGFVFSDLYKGATQLDLKSWQWLPVG